MQVAASARQKPMENKLLRGPCPGYRPKTVFALDLVAGECFVTAVPDALGIARPPRSAMRNRPLPRGRPPLPDAELVADIRLLVADLPNTISSKPLNLSYQYLPLTDNSRDQARRTLSCALVAEHLRRRKGKGGRRNVVLS